MERLWRRQFGNRRGLMEAPAVVFISYHYPPSNEIGARRNGALVRWLVELNIRVIVVSRFGDSTLTSHGSDSLTHEVRIPDSRRWLLKSVVATKHFVSRLLSRVRMPGAAEVERTSGAPALDRSPRRPVSVRQRLVQLIVCLDEYKMWSWRAAWAAHAACGRLNAQALIASGPPMTNLLAGLWVARLRRIPFIADFRDPWYAGFEDLPQPSAFERELRSSMERLLLNRSTAVTVTTDSLAQRLMATYPAATGRVHVVRNGFDGEPRRLPTSTGHYLRFLFAGEIYVNRDPFPFLEALERLLALDDTDGSRVSVTFVGHCEAYRGVRLADWLRGKRCEGLVRVLPPVTRQTVEAMQAQSSVLLNFAQASILTVPAKTYEHMASGREILVLSEAHSSTARLVGGIVGVTCVDPTDTVSMDRAVADLYHRHVIIGELTSPPVAAVRGFAREVQSGAFTELVQSLLARKTDERS
jgi:hypothetical protein